MSRQIKQTPHLEKEHELYQAALTADAVRFLLFQENGRIFAFQMQHNRICQVTASAENDALTIGTILIARVDHVLKQMNGCFLTLNEQKEKAFLSLEKDAALLRPVNRVPDGRVQEGDLLIVQIKREASRAKPIQVTGSWEIAGPFAAVRKGTGKLAFSAKLRAEKRSLLTRAFAEWKETLSEEEKQVLSQTDWILRTKAGESEPDLPIRSISELFAVFTKIDQKGQNMCQYNILYQPEPAYLQLLENADPSQPFEIVTEHQALLDRLRNHSYLQRFPMRLYQDDRISLKKVYALDTRLRELLSEKVSMKSGAFLVIQQTEALVSIDVNSGNSAGKFAAKSDPEAYFLQCNLEAAQEILYQLSVRNLSGQIIIDFINMKPQKNIDTLLAFLRDAVRKDPVTTTYVDYTGLGLVELTRRKAASPLKDQMAGWNWD